MVKPHAQAASRITAVEIRRNVKAARPVRLFDIQMR
jgi:hypothetical protein